MDSIFASKTHQSYERARRVEQSKASALAKYIDKVRVGKQKDFDDRHTVGGTLLEVSTNALEDSKPARLAYQKNDLARVYKE